MNKLSNELNRRDGADGTGAVVVVALVLLDVMDLALSWSKTLVGLPLLARDGEEGRGAVPSLSSLATTAPSASSLSGCPRLRLVLLGVDGVVVLLSDESDKDVDESCCWLE